jgi:hypothetical protein
LSWTVECNIPASIRRSKFHAALMQDFFVCQQVIFIGAAPERYDGRVFQEQQHIFPELPFFVFANFHLQLQSLVVGFCSAPHNKAFAYLVHVILYMDCPAAVQGMGRFHDSF